MNTDQRQIARRKSTAIVAMRLSEGSMTRAELAQVTNFSLSVIERSLSAMRADKHPAIQNLRRQEPATDNRNPTKLLEQAWMGRL